jgi:DNA-binding transcriptional ArsR family regulator
MRKRDRSAPTEPFRTYTRLMVIEIDLAAVARLLAEPARMTMLEALLGGGTRSGRELAAAAGVAPSTASEHLAQLQDGGLVTVAQDGRKRAYALSGPPVAEALEALAALAPPKPVNSLRQATAAQLHREARTCYDHLAGSLGVAVCDALVAHELLDPADGGWTVTHRGERDLAVLDIDVADLRSARRPLTRICIDWSERRPHLAGGLGAALATRLLERRWLERRPDMRAVAVTPDGRRELAAWLGVEPDCEGGWIAGAARPAHAA